MTEQDMTEAVAALVLDPEPIDTSWCDDTSHDDYNRMGCRECNPHAPGYEDLAEALMWLRADRGTE